MNYNRYLRYNVECNIQKGTKMSLNVNFFIVITIIVVSSSVSSSASSQVVSTSSKLSSKSLRVSRTASAMPPSFVQWMRSGSTSPVMLQASKECTLYRRAGNFLIVANFRIFRMMPRHTKIKSTKSFTFETLITSNTRVLAKLVGVAFPHVHIRK